MIRCGSVAQLVFVGLGMGLCSAPFSDAQAAEPPATSAVDFAREIRPLLAQHCWSCHGPDEKSRRASLRLDVRDIAVESGAIVPGDPAASELLLRINSDDETTRMPPPDAKKPLTLPQRQLLRAWIAQGADYRQHWAFDPPTRPDPPAVQNAAWPLSAVDRFVLQRLEQAGLTPAPPADRGTLLRRVTLDLTGLPPTLAELDDFIADSAPDAYERVVDRLLGSPRYAERMALAWLDAARYADTNGYNNDEDRSMWPWRDWVIDAFHRNQPYDQFIVEQLAGDLLPDATLAQQVATGFHRNQGHNTEGGIVAEEYRVEYVADRVHTTATVFLGLSLQCARCHDHKFDPLTTREYYQFYAFFNNIAEKPASYGNFFAAEPYLRVPSDRQQRQLAGLTEERQQAERRIVEREAAAESLFAQWERTASAAELQEFAQQGLLLSLALDETQGETVQDATNPVVTGTIRGKSQWSEGKLAGALELDGQTYVDLAQQGNYDGTSPFSIGVWVQPSSTDTMAILSKMDEAGGYRGYDLLLEAGGKIAAHLVHHWPDNGMKVITRKALTPKVWQHVLLTYNGSRTAAGLKFYVDGKLQATDVSNDKLTETIATDKPLHLGRRQTSLPFSGKLDEVQFYEQELTPEHAAELAAGRSITLEKGLLSVPAADRTPDQKLKLQRRYLDRVDVEYPRLKAALAEAIRRKDDLDKSLPAVMVMQDLPHPRETFVLTRGEYDQPGEKVVAGVPSALSPFPQAAPLNRLGLARWIVDPANPLTARVVVNRWWQMYFGVGLVKTTEDFGATGEAPSHPELLDYLATELIRSGWDVKALQKRIVLSATYRQSSRVAPGLAERDPENRLLARGPRFRLSAETIRDSALAISGLLAGPLGGPSVKPYQPAGLWEDVSVERRAKYVADQGDGLFRRSMYTFWKRTCPPPSLMSFDATNREVCIVRRGRTNTPLQALILMNDPTYVEAARHLAERALAAGPSSESRLRQTFRLTLSREPRADEQSVLLDLYETAHARFRQDGAAAAKLLAVGNSPRADGLDAAELAAWTVLCSTLLNLDEAITKR